MRAHILKTAAIVKSKAGAAQNGAVTQIHGHAITPQSFSTTKEMPSNPTIGNDTVVLCVSEFIVNGYDWSEIAFERRPLFIGCRR